MDRLKGAASLIFDGVEEITNLVERTHARTARKTFRPLTVVEPVATVAKGVGVIHDLTASGVYGSIRAVNRAVRKLVGVGAQIADDLRPGSEGPALSDLGKTGQGAYFIDHAESALNAVCGDYLGKKQNGLDIGMQLRHGGRTLPVEREAFSKSLPDATGKICVFVHGLGCTESVWRTAGDANVTFGSKLRADLGYTPLYVRYNTGRHVSENGRRLSALLARLWDAYPCEIEEIAIIGHSMGGLVARSAAHYGNAQNAPWVGRLRHILSLGSPNLGAPLEKGANILSGLLRFFKTAGTEVPAEILNARSAGIKDLRFGYTVDEEWAGTDPDMFYRDLRRNVPFIDGVDYCWIGAVITDSPEHPVGRLLGDLLVRTGSASGKPRSPERTLPFAVGTVFNGMHHMELARHPEVYRFIRRHIEARQAGQICR